MERNELQSLQELKEEEKIKILDRANNGILEKENADFLIKLIDNAENKTEVLKISALGMTYKRTGFHFDVRLEKNEGQTIRYLKKNENLSFDQGGITHKLIIGDNYPALLNLLINYKNKIKVIYIDPPYGKDDLGEFAQTNYNNAITRDNLLSMLYPRLILARQLLKDDGVIFCSIDDRNQAYVKCLFDEVFGEENFCGNIVWQKKKGGGQDSQYFAKEHEYILCYKKNTWIINNKTEKFSEENFNKIINNRKASLTKLEKWGIGALMEDAPSLYYPIKDPNNNDFYPMAPNGQKGRWRKKPENLDADHIFWKENSKGRLTPYEVVYFDEVDVRIVKMRTIFTDYGTTTDATKEIQKIFGNKIFDTPKPVSLIKHIIDISTDLNDDIILDFFAGSGTTGHAVLELNKQDGGNRQFILVTNNEITDSNPNGIALDVTSKRLKRIMSGECYDKSKDFKWLEKNTPYGDSLEVSEIQSIASSDHSVFEKIDEKLYGKVFENLHDKIEWICKEFELTCRKIEGE
ncbi:site-specific DNA-methyltransferase [Campylobacter jejuni]